MGFSVFCFFFSLKKAAGWVTMVVAVAVVVVDVVDYVVIVVVDAGDITSS